MLAAMDRRMRLFAAALVAVFLLHALYLSGIAEDAFISFRYARNWVNGAGLVWNPGEAPVEGYTNFLWVALAAGMLALGFDPLVGSQLLGIGASLVTLGRLQRVGADESAPPASRQSQANSTRAGWVPRRIAAAWLERR
jgi:hypothetical protein